ncbi:MAG: cation diffusion facilitator family transporter [Candidatus Melainabacteria bacterium]|nr:cation diffusion facilitator family transporter [Candidatus Melainabacteria bacterium]
MTHCHHHHHHHHASTQPQPTRRLFWVFLLTVFYLAVEVVGGFMTGSLSLMADAGHMFTDAGSLALALFAAWFSRRNPPNTAHTYGYYRLEVLAAFVNGLLLLLVVFGILWEGLQRLWHPSTVAAEGMLVVAVGGLLVNLLALRLLHTNAQENLNVRGAYLHILGDLFGSVAAIVAGILMWQWGWWLADPLCSLLVSGLISLSAVRLIRESADVLLESSPAHVPLEAVVQAIAETPGVLSVHDLHVWTISNDNTALSAHVVVTPEHLNLDTLGRLHQLLQERFSLKHLTLQLETAHFRADWLPHG